MTFPQQPRPMLYELQIGATDWANITPYVFSQRTVTNISRGVPGEYSQSSPAVCTFDINNANGLFSPRNPLSPIWDKIGKNTPVRVSIGEGAYGLVLGGVNATAGFGCGASLDSVQLSPTGDLDVRVDMEILPNSSRLWNSGSFDLIGKFNDVDSDRAYALTVNAGKPRLSWFTAGTAGSARIATSSATLPGTLGRLAVRATLDVNNGAGGVDVKFYTAPTMAGPWTQLGTTQTSAGTSSIFDASSFTRVGAFPSASAWSYGVSPGATVYSAQIYASINGTNLIASPDWTTQGLDPVPFGISPFNDAQGNNWFFSGGPDQARVWYGKVDIRFWGETSAFPNRWDVSGRDAWVPIEAAGLLRRLGNGQEPAQTGLRDWVEDQSPLPVSYFPLTGAEGTKYSVNQGRIGKNKFRFYPEQAPVYTYGSDFGTTYLGTGLEINTTGFVNNMRADVGVPDDNFTLDFVFRAPPATDDAGVDLVSNVGVLTINVWDYSFDRWQLQLNDAANSGKLTVTWFASDGVGTTVFPATALLPALKDNGIHTCRFHLETQSLGTIQAYQVYIDGQAVDFNAVTPSRPKAGTSLYQVFYSRNAGQTVVTLGHFAGWVGTPPSVFDFDDAARGYAEEQAGDRMTRIAAAGGIPFRIHGSANDTIAMGPQFSESKLSQLRDAEAADMGYLLEPRDAFGLEYRTRVSMVGQSPALTLDYSLGQVVPPFEPTDDDLLTKNSVTATRREGDSYRAQLTTGKLSILDPPLGVGQYHDQVEVNVATDAMLPGVAAWLVNLGTIDQARYPAVTVDLGILAAAGLDQAARAVDTGDLLVITGMDALGVYEDVRLLVLGTGAETISDGAYKHTITWNCAPYQGFEGAVYATNASTGTARYDSDGSQLAAGINSSATSFQVNATKGILWTTDAAAFPLEIMVAGERMRVSAVTGTTSPQTFTISARAVNGVSKAQVGGAEVRLADPAYYSL